MRPQPGQALAEIRAGHADGAYTWPGDPRPTPRTHLSKTLLVTGRRKHDCDPSQQHLERGRQTERWGAGHRRAAPVLGSEHILCFGGKQDRRLLC